MSASVPCSETYTEVNEQENITEIIHLRLDTDNVISKHSEEFTNFCVYCNDKQKFD